MNAGIAKCMLAAAISAAMSMAMVAHAAGSSPQLERREVVQPGAQAQSGARIIVKYRSGTAESTQARAKATSVRAAAARAGLLSARRTPDLSASVMRRLGTGADLMRLSSRLDRAGLEQLVREIAEDPSVEYAQIDERDQLLAPLRKMLEVQPALIPNDPHFAGYQWNFQPANAGGIDAPGAWEIANGEGVVVAVLDTGILPEHPDMSAGQLLEGYDFITDAWVSRRETNDRVPGAFDYGDWNDDESECDVSGSSFHGTHVAGTVAETTNNGIGAAGLAHGAKVLPMRVLGRCGGYTSDIADAIIWASGGSVSGVPANQNPAEVINLSLGSASACNATYQTAIDIAVANGATVVVSAGNSNVNAGNFRPAGCNNVIAVAASRITGGRAWYSNYGAVVDLAAPGGGGSEDTGNNGWDGYILQAGHNSDTSPDQGSYTYIGMAGTSMASPHVAATVAMVQGALVAADRDPLTPAQMEAMLRSTARPFPVTIPTSTPIGAGILDPLAALEEALAVPCDPEVEACEPDATPIVNKVAVTGLSGTAGSQVLYSLDVPAGARGPLSILTSGGSGNVSLLVSFGEEPQPGDAGHTSARPGNNETVRVGTPQAGKYYIKLVGTGAYSNVRLIASHN